MKRVTCIIFFLVTIGSIKAQIATEHGTPIKWDQDFDRTIYVMRGLDTLSKDSILLTRDKYTRQNQEGLVLEELNYSNLNIVNCNDDGPQLTGYWTSYYETGEIKEMGKIICNQKFGEWLYFYESGKIKKYERYDGIDIIDSNPNVGLSNGPYLEYFENGNLKTSGTFRIIEKYSKFPIVDPATYEPENRCCVWKPISMKYGPWLEYNEEGILISKTIYDLEVSDSMDLREIGDRYLRININDVYKK